MQLACRHCGFVGKAHNFSKDRSRPTGFRSICKVCWREKARKYRQADPDRAKAIQQRSNRNTCKRVPGLSYQEKRQKLDEIKHCRGCFFCQEGEPVALDFHHRNPSEKKFTISAEIAKPIELLLEEAAKCEVICANCHRKLHHGLLKLEKG